MKDIFFSTEARAKLASGVQKLTDTVKVTMGPSGRNVLIEKPHGPAVLTKDGVSVAQEVFLDDPEENLGAQLIKEVSVNVADEAGDGTTTATVLANSIFQGGLKNVAAGSNPVEIKRGMDFITEHIVQELKNKSKRVTTSLEIQQVATISANGDTHIGKMISDAMVKVGNDGIITVEEAKGTKDELEIVEGTVINNGYLSPYFVNNTDKMVCEFREPLILLTSFRIIALSDILPVLEHSQQTKRPLLIVCDDVDGDALSTMVVNKMRGTLDICVVKAPGFGDNRLRILEDLAVLTGGTVLSQESGRLLKNVTKEDLGEASRVKVDKRSCTIVDAPGDITERVKEIKTLISTASSQYETDNLKDRLAKLSGGVAVIRVGASTETEMKEKRDRIDDALGATKAAIQEGIIIGGGSALLKASKDSSIIERLQELSGDQKIGAEIVLKSLHEPIRQIIENAGDESALIISNIGTEKPEIGWNASTREYKDMYQDGIIDSLKVARVALENAVSVSSMLLTTEATITIKDKNEPK